MWVKNITNFGRFCYLNIPCRRIIITLIFMSSQAKNSSISRKTGKQMFLLVSGGYAVPERDSNLAKSFFRISDLKDCTDLIFGKTFCIFIFFHFPDSRRSVLNGLHFYFSLRDSANRE